MQNTLLRGVIPLEPRQSAASAPLPSAERAQRQRQLAAAAAQLKSELIGIDEVIDRVIDAIRAWYVLPQLIQRPVIVCLWGLTGTGKTQLTRRLAQLLIERVLIGDDGLEILWRDAGWVELIEELRPGSIGAELAETEMTA